MPYFPLASGLLTGKYRAGEPAPAGSRLSGRGEIADEAQFGLLAALEGYADTRGVGILEVAIGALLAAAQVVTVIAGATNVDQVAANAAAAQWRPSDDDLSVPRTVLSDHPV